MSSAGVGARILLGYLAACVAVGVGLWAPPVLLSTASALIFGQPYPDYSHATIVLIFLLYAAITIVSTILLTAVPALFLILIAERLKVRVWWGYAIGAAFIGLLAYGLVPLMLPWTGGAPFETAAGIDFAALGAGAGLIYWFIAIRGRDHQPLPVTET